LLPGRHRGSPHSPPKKDLPVPDDLAGLTRSGATDSIRGE
jgi:hypothetical protein